MRIKQTSNLLRENNNIEKNLNTTIFDLILDVRYLAIVNSHVRNDNSSYESTWNEVRNMFCIAGIKIMKYGHANAIPFITIKLKQCLHHYNAK